MISLLQHHIKFQFVSIKKEEKEQDNVLFKCKNFYIVEKKKLFHHNFFLLNQ